MDTKPQVRVGLAKKDANGKRHLVVRCDATYGQGLKPVIARHILPPGTLPVERFRGTDVLFLFNITYLDRILLAFPDAILSNGVRSRLAKKEVDVLADQEVPDVHIPGCTAELWPFQKQGVVAGVEALRKNRHVFMLNDEVGLGKTLQALGMAILLKRKRVLVVTTKSGCGAWAKIMRTHFPRVTHAIVDGNAADRANAARSTARVILVNFEALRVQPFDQDGNPWRKEMTYISGKRKTWRPANPDLFNQRYDMIIVDEFHRVKNPGAQQTIGFLQLPRADYELLMSGTPFLNTPVELWPSLHRLWPSKFPSHYQFKTNLELTAGGSRVAYNPDEMANLRQWLAKRTLRRRKDQVGIQMPEVIYSTVECDMTPEQRRLYQEIESDLLLRLESGEIHTIVGALPRIIRCKQACFSPELYGGSSHSVKIDEVKETVAQLVANNEKALILTQFEAGAKILYRELKDDYNPAYVTGEVTGYTKVNGVRMSKRTVQEDKFNEDDTCKVYIGTIRANQEAITLSAATYVLLVDEDWSPNANDQAIGRSAAGGLRGINATGPVNVIKFQCRDSIELDIESLNEYKRSLSNSVVETDGGRRRDVTKITVKDLRERLEARKPKRKRKKAS